MHNLLLRIADFWKNLTNVVTSLESFGTRNLQAGQIISCKGEHFLIKSLYVPDGRRLHWAADKLLEPQEAKAKDLHIMGYYKTCGQVLFSVGPVIINPDHLDKYYILASEKIEESEALEGLEDEPTG